MPASALKALSSISRIDLAKSLEQILEEILTIVGHQIGGHSGSMMLANEETGELELVATFGLPDDCIERIYNGGFPITNSPAGVVLETGRHYAVPNIFEASRDKPWYDLSHDLGMGISAQMFMPIKRKDEVIGLLNIYMAEPHEFTQDEFAFVVVAASQAAAVIENARLYTKISKEKVGLESEVTEHKRVQELLWKSREILSNILSASPIGIGIVKDRKLSWTNERMMEMFGFKPDEDDYIGQSAEVIYASKEEYERVGRVFYNELKGAKLAEVDAKLKRRDGSLFYGHIKMSFLDPSNPAKGAIATISDISWRKQAEEALRVSEEKYRKLVGNVQDGIFILQGYPYPKLMFCNEAFAKMVGYTVEEMMELTIQKYVAPDDLARVADSYRRRLDGEDVPREYEYRVLHKDGKTLVYVNMHAELMEYQGKIATIGTVKDITEHKRAEEALQESEERFRSLFDNLSVGVAMIDLEGQVLAANKTVCRFLDYSQEELIGMPLSELIYPEDLDADRDLFEPIIKDEEDHCLMDKRYVRKNGEIVWGRLHVSGIKDEGGHIKYMSVICEDITACKLVEKALLAKNSELASVFARCKHMKEALNRSEQKYKEIAEFLPDLIYKTILLDA